MGSCLSRASIGAFLDLTITITGCEVNKGIGLSGVTIEVVLQVLNPNLRQLDATNITVKIRKKSDGIVVADANVPREFLILSNETPTIRLTVTFQYNGLGAAGASLLRRGETTIDVCRAHARQWYHRHTLLRRLHNRSRIRKIKE
jgi:LEA14-like dessication related protein